jgi:dTDP-4-amino-4,6-dideoxygalactose transaminase
MIPIAHPLIGQEEKRAVLEVLESGMLAQGSRVAAFEAAFAQYCGTRHAVATSSGTSALHVALLAHDLGPGDEVITTPFTFVASANVIIYVGAQPVFVDIQPETFNIDPRLVEAAITSRTRAILPVHLFGLPADLDALMEIARRHHLAVIEDACQAHGASYRGQRVGSFGTGCFSFYPTKNMTTAESGMITTNDDLIADRCRLIRQHGSRQRYRHDTLGFNFRMTELQAAIGLVQLEKLEKFNEQRIANARHLTERLRGVQVPVVPFGSRHVFHQYTVRVSGGRRDAMLDGLRSRGIGADVYYPLPVHAQPFYRERGHTACLPQAERASREVLSLPVHPGLQSTDLELIVAGVNELSADAGHGD